MMDENFINNQTYYNRLEISPDDDLSDSYIQHKFRVAAFKLHPDKEKSNEAASSENMALLIEARDTLLNPEKRAAYDEKIFGSTDFVSRVKETISEAQKELRETTTNEHPYAFYRLKNYCFIKAINYCHDSIQRFGYNSCETKYFQKLLEGLDHSFFSHSINSCCFEMYLLITSNLIEPIEKQINTLRLSSDKICQIKASQLEYLLDEINEAVFQAHFKGTREIEWGEHKFISYNRYITAEHIYLNLHEKLINCASKKEINFHRNLIVDTIKALAGVAVVLLTLLPDISLYKSGKSNYAL
jgi:curved DNA-binding protein CbpA